MVRSVSAWSATGTLTGMILFFSLLGSHQIYGLESNPHRDDRLSGFYMPYLPTLNDGIDYQNLKKGPPADNESDEIESLLPSDPIDSNDDHFNS
jgi:hypothetical protein